MLKSSGRTNEVSVMEMEEWPQVIQMYEGTPCAMKVACTVWCGGKGNLPIAIKHDTRNNRAINF